MLDIWQVYGKGDGASADDDGDDRAGVVHLAVFDALERSRAGTLEGALAWLPADPVRAELRRLRDRDLESGTVDSLWRLLAERHVDDPFRVAALEARHRRFVARIVALQNLRDAQQAARRACDEHDLELLALLPAESQPKKPRRKRGAACDQSLLSIARLVALGFVTETGSPYKGTVVKPAALLLFAALEGRLSGVTLPTQIRVHSPASLWSWWKTHGTTLRRTLWQGVAAALGLGSCSGRVRDGGALLDGLDDVSRWYDLGCVEREQREKRLSLSR